jgi:hypothetical protein
MGQRLLVFAGTLKAIGCLRVGKVADEVIVFIGDFEHGATIMLDIRLSVEISDDVVMTKRKYGLIQFVAAGEDSLPLRYFKDIVLYCYRNGRQ